MVELGLEGQAVDRPADRAFEPVAGLAAGVLAGQADVGPGAGEDGVEARGSGRGRRSRGRRCRAWPRSASSGAPRRRWSRRWRAGHGRPPGRGPDGEAEGPEPGEQGVEDREGEVPDPTLAGLPAQARSGSGPSRAWPGRTGLASGRRRAGPCDRARRLGSTTIGRRSWRRRRRRSGDRSPRPWPGAAGRPPAAGRTAPTRPSMLMSRAEDRSIVRSARPAHQPRCGESRRASRNRPRGVVDQARPVAGRRLAEDPDVPDRSARSRQRAAASSRSRSRARRPAARRPATTAALSRGRRRTGVSQIPAELTRLRSSSHRRPGWPDVAEADRRGPLDHRPGGGDEVEVAGPPVVPLQAPGDHGGLVDRRGLPLGLAVDGVFLEPVGIGPGLPLDRCRATGRPRGRSRDGRAGRSAAPTQIASRGQQ